MPKSILLNSTILFILALGASYLGSSFFINSGQMDNPAPLEKEKSSTTSKAPRQEILDRNIMQLRIPLSDEELKERPDPRNWPVRGILKASRPLAWVKTDQGRQAVAPGDVISGWELTEIRENYIEWTLGEVTRRKYIRAEEEEVKLQVGKANKVEIARNRALPLLSDPTKLMDMALYKPNRQGGRVRGFRISNVQEGSILDRIGIKGGDILLRINGRLLTGPGELLQAYSGLEKAQSLSMDVQRGGESLSLILEIQ
jgi:general secretion pathway protein C